MRRRLVAVGATVLAGGLLVAGPVLATSGPAGLAVWNGVGALLMAGGVAGMVLARREKEPLR